MWPISVGGGVLAGRTDDDVLIGQLDLPAGDVDVPLLHAIDDRQRRDAELVEPLAGVRQPHLLVLIADHVDLRDVVRLLQPVADAVGEVLQLAVGILVPRIAAQFALQRAQILDPERLPDVRIELVGADGLAFPAVDFASEDRRGSCRGSA